jgi:hypothetical protein
LPAGPAADPPLAAELAYRAGGRPPARGEAHLQGRRPPHLQRSSPAGPVADPAHVAEIACRGAAVNDDPPTKLAAAAEKTSSQPRRTSPAWPAAAGRGEMGEHRARCGMAPLPPSPPLPLLHTPLISTDRLPPSHSRAGVRSAESLPPLRVCGGESGGCSSPFVRRSWCALPRVARRGSLDRGDKGGNFTFSQHRVISFYCAVYQTRTHQPSLSLFTLPNTSGLH